MASLPKVTLPRWAKVSGIAAAAIAAATATIEGSEQYVMLLSRIAETLMAFKP